MKRERQDTEVSEKCNPLPPKGVFLVDIREGKSGRYPAIEPKSAFTRYSGTENEMWNVDFTYLSEVAKKRKHYKGWNAQVSMAGVLGGLMDVVGMVPVRKKGRQMFLASREVDVYLLEGAYKTYQKATRMPLRKFCEEHSKDVIHGTTPYVKPHQYAYVVGADVAENVHDDDFLAANLLYESVTNGEAGKLFDTFGPGWVELYEVYVTSRNGKAFYIFANDGNKKSAIFKNLPERSDYRSLKDSIDIEFHDKSSQ